MLGSGWIAGFAQSVELTVEGHDCSTADGEVSGAEGLRSLARAFVQAGGQAVIGSLWNLPDASTAMTIDRFYTALDRGAAAGSALQAAQLAIAGTDPYANSRAWTALVIVGDPKLMLEGGQRIPWTAIAAVVAAIGLGWLASRYFTWTTTSL